MIEYNDLTDSEKVRVDRQRRFSELHWYVLFVTPLHELRLWEYFTGKPCPDRRHVSKKDRQGNLISDPVLNPPIEAYVPYRIERRKWSDRIKKVPCLLAPGIIFVRIKLDNRSALFVDDKVRSFLYDHDRHEPVAIADWQMEQFRMMVEMSPDISMVVPVPGETVKIVKGAFKGMVGEVVRRRDEHSVKFQITLTGQCAFQMDLTIDDFIVVPKGTLPDLHDITYK